MHQSEDEFVRKWRKVLACGFFFGAVSESKDGLLARASKLLDIPDEVDALLHRMWQEDERLKPPPVPVPVSSAPPQPAVKAAPSPNHHPRPGVPK